MTISTDTQFVHLAWKREEKELGSVEFPMGADPTGNVGRMFGVLDEGSGLTLRGNPQASDIEAAVGAAMARMQEG